MVKSALSSVYSLLLLAVLFILTVLWRIGFYQKRLRPFTRKFGTQWLVWRGRRLITAIILTLCGLSLFIQLATNLPQNQLTGFDLAITQAIIAWRSPWLTRFLGLLTHFGSVSMTTGIVLALVILGRRLGRRTETYYLLFCISGAHLINESLKAAFHRARPPLPWLGTASGFSFPSGHSLLAMALYGFLAYLILRGFPNQSGRYPVAGGLLVTALAVGVSRVYLGVHFPSDVLAGWASAVAWIGLCMIGFELSNPYFKTEQPKRS